MIGDPARTTAGKALIRRALREDIGAGDATSQALVPASAQVRAQILCRESCIVCGQSIAAQVFRAVDRKVRYRILVPDGREARKGAVLAVVAGRARAILAGERVALNFLQRLTGIATLTRRFVRAVKPRRVRILDTRKTTPTLRACEKYAVRCGGGYNHRMGLDDRILIKDNHRRLWQAGTKTPLRDAIQEARRRHPGLEVEIEVENEAEFADALRGAPEWVLLDNMDPETMRRCVRRKKGHMRIEASGGIQLANIRKVAASGVDAVSLGCLTHSAPAADLSLEIDDEHHRGH